MSGRLALPSLRSALGALLVFTPATLLLAANGPASKPATAAPAVRAESPRLTLAFEPAAGRFGADVRFLARRDGYALGLMRDGSTVLSSGRVRVRTQLVGARPRPAVEPESLLPGKVNSFVGRDRSKWRSGLPTYGAVRFDEVYPGTDLVYHGRQGVLEYDYVLRPGADPGRIRMAITGARPRLTADGDLLMRTESGPLRQRRPVAYQEIGGRRLVVPASFTLDGRRVGFELGDYDERRPLVIDPQLIFTSYFGGPQGDTGNAVAVTQTGGTFLLVGGATKSNEFHGSNPNTTSNLVFDDAWISKLSADGSTVLWTTFIGGTSHDSITAISAGTPGIMVAGGTASADFPVNVSLGTPYDTVLSGTGDAWLGRVDSASGSLDVATFFGGPGTDGPVDVAYRYPRVYVAGNTTSASDIASTGAEDETLGGGSDGYAAAFSANLAARHWGTYIGGTSTESLGGFTMDQENPPSLYATGWSQSDDFPVTVGSGNADNLDAFLVKLPRIEGATGSDPDLPADGTTFGYSRLISGTPSSVESGEDIWANSGTAVIVGYSDASTLPGTSAVDPGPGFDGFAIAASHLSGTTVFGGAFIGGNGANGGSNEAATAVTADPFGGPVHIAGVTNSTNLGTVNPVQSQNAGSDDAFVAKYTSNLGNAVYVSYLGGTGAERVNDIALDTLTESAYVVGTTGSTNLGATAAYSGTPNPVQPNNAGGGDAFIAKIQPLSAVITGGPAEGSTTANSTANFTLGPTGEANSSFQCKLDNGSFAACTSTPSFPGLSDGPHALSVRYFDRGGDTNGSVAVRNWTVDTTAPPTLLEPGHGAELGASQPALSWAGSGGSAAHYDVELDGNELGLGLDPATDSYTPAALIEGPHEWRVIAVDQFGTKTFSSRRTFRVDLTPPNAQLSASPNPMLAGRTATLDASASNDPAGGRITRFEWDLDGDGTFETDAGAAPTITKSFSASGAYLMAVRVTDPVGRTAVAATTLIVTTPPIPPGQLGVTVDNGAQFTRSADVKLNLVFPTTTTQFLVSNDGGFLAPTTFAPAREISWKLDSSGPERLPKTVYVRFLLGGIVSETYTDDIILDEIPPVVSQATVVPPAAGARAAAVRTWTVRVRATDSNSGVNGVQITARKSRPGRFLRYKRTMKVKAATRKLYVRARDRAGNLSRWRRAR